MSSITYDMDQAIPSPYGMPSYESKPLSLSAIIKSQWNNFSDMPTAASIDFSGDRVAAYIKLITMANGLIGLQLSLTHI